MSRRLIVLAIVLFALGCHDGDDCEVRVVQPPTLLCHACDGEGPDIVIPVTAEIDTWHVCFATSIETPVPLVTCWYDCPEGSTTKGGEVCE